MTDVDHFAVPRAIGDDEHAARIDAVRAVLAERDLDVLLAYGAHRDYQPADLRWLARWYCVEEETSCVVVPVDGPTALVTDASWDLERAQAEAYADEFTLAGDMGLELARLVRDRAGDTAHVGIAGFHFLPAPVYLRLVEALPDATFVDASDVTTGLRMIKSPAELDLLRAASRISDAAMRAGLEQVRDGAAEIEVAAAAEAVIRGAGAEPSFVTEMGTGPRTAYGTFLPGMRRMASGEVAVLDCGARIHGYHGDMCRTVVVGGPDAVQRSRLEAVEQALQAAIGGIRPGVSVGEVRDLAADSIRKSGFGDNWWDAFMPHGNGAGQHEPPNAKEHPGLPLREGMVLCVEPGIMVPDDGAFIIEQMIAVGAEGAEILNGLPTDMWDRL